MRWHYYVKERIAYTAVTTNIKYAFMHTFEPEQLYIQHMLSFEDDPEAYRSDTRGWVSARLPCCWEIA
jgi:hypothetical protein